MFGEKTLLHGKGLELEHKAVLGRNGHLLRVDLKDTFFFSLRISFLLAVLFAVGLWLGGLFFLDPTKYLGLSALVLHEDVLGHRAARV